MVSFAWNKAKKRTFTVDIITTGIVVDFPVPKMPQNWQTKAYFDVFLFRWMKRTISSMKTNYYRINCCDETNVIAIRVNHLQEEPILNTYINKLIIKFTLQIGRYGLLMEQVPLTLFVCIPILILSLPHCIYILIINIYMARKSFWWVPFVDWKWNQYSKSLHPIFKSLFIIAKTFILIYVNCTMYTCSVWYYLCVWQI